MKKLFWFCGTLLLLTPSIVLAETSTTNAINIPLFIALAGLCFFGASFFKKIWPMPLTSFILLIGATILSLGSDVIVCETTKDLFNLTNSTSVCVTQTVYAGGMTYIFGGLSLLALMILFFRILEGLGKKNQDY